MAQGTSIVAVQGNIAAGATDAGNPVKVGGRFNTTQPTLTDGQRGNLELESRGALKIALYSGVTAITRLQDNNDTVAATSAADKLAVLSRNSVANGTNWDRQSVVTNGTNSTGTGITAAGIIAQFDDVSPTAITENQFGNVRISSRREVYTQIRDAAGNERGVNVDANGGIPITIESAQTLATVTTVSTLTNQSQEGGVNISLNAGSVDTGTRRVVQANGAGKTIVSKSGSASTNGNNTLVAAGTNKLKVFAFSLSTQSTTAVTCKFQDGASGTDLWSVILQAPTSVSTGANLAVSPPAWLFNTSAATLLNLNLSSANAVQWSVSYFDEA
jgi:hypothetical protein